MPSNPTLNTRKLGTIKYTSGSRESLELDKNGVLLRLFIRLRYTITNSATAPVTPVFQALARLIQRVEVMAGGRDIVQSIPGYFLPVRAYYEQEGIPCLGMGATVVTTASAVTNYDLVFPIDFTLPLGARNDDCALDTTGLNQLSLMVTWGKSDASDIFVTPNGAAISNVLCEIEGQYVANPMRNQAGAAVSGVSGKPYLVRSLEWSEQPITATNNNYGLILDSRTGLVVTSFLIAAMADNQGVDTVVNAMKMDAASFNFFIRDAQPVRAANTRNLRLNGGTIPGVLYVDPRFNGSIINAINTADLQGDLKASFDVNLVGTVCKLCLQKESVRPLIL